METPFGLPPDVVSQPINEWQLNLVTLFVISQLLGRAFVALRNSGGLKGIFAAIWLGTNTPKKDTTNEKP